jgi:hypothetical protein
MVRDQFKDKKCGANNVVLVRVSDRISFAKMQEYIVAECRKRSLPIPDNVQVLDYRSFVLVSKPIAYLSEIKSIVEGRGGTLFTTHYTSCASKLDALCERSHPFQPTRDSLLADKWCHTCAKENQRGSWLRLLQIIQAREGICHSAEKDFETRASLIQLGCKRSHESWQQTVRSLREGHWCWECAQIEKSENTVEITLEDAKELAESRGATRTSPDGSGSDYHFTFFCPTHKHTFTTSYAAYRARNKYCCPVEGNTHKGHHFGPKPKLTLEEIKEACAAKNLRFVSVVKKPSPTKTKQMPAADTKESNKQEPSLVAPKSKKRKRIRRPVAKDPKTAGLSKAHITVECITCLKQSNPTGQLLRKPNAPGKEHLSGCRYCNAKFKGKRQKT